MWEGAVCVGSESVGTAAAYHSFSAALSPLRAALLPTSFLPPDPACPPRHRLYLPRCPCCRLGEIQSVAGQAAPRQEVLDALVGGDFDPEEYDRQMAAAFGEDYYGAVSALLCGRAGPVMCMLCCGAHPGPACAMPWCGTSRYPPPLQVLLPLLSSRVPFLLPAVPAARAVQDADGDEDDLEDEAFEKELEAMAKYGSDDEEPQSFAALHKRLTAQRREQAAAGARVGWAGVWVGGWVAGPGGGRGLA